MSEMSRGPGGPVLRTIGAFAAAAIGLAALAVVLVARPGESTTTRRSDASSATGVAAAEPRLPNVDYTLDLPSGVKTPLPDSIVVSSRDFGTSQWTKYAASPDGSLLAYVGVGGDGSSQIFIGSIASGGTRQVTHDRREAMSPAWSPDGSKVAYVGYDGYDAANARELFVVDVATGSSKQITHGAGGNVWDTQFTPDGSSLLYTGGTDEYPGLRTVPISGGRSTSLIGPGTGVTGSGNGSLSPDGSLVTFLGGGTPPSGSRHCGPCRFVANADGTHRRVVPGWISNPAGAWSPDGERIVASHRYDSVVVVEVATGAVAAVAEGRSAIWLDDHTLPVDVA
jgi:Tol biopolymer transport system component